MIRRSLCGLRSPPRNQRGQTHNRCATIGQEQFALAPQQRLCDNFSFRFIVSRETINRAKSKVAFDRAARMPGMFGRNRPPLTSYEAERIAVIKPSAQGAIIQSLPVLTALRRRYPHAHITWVVNQSYAPLLHGHRDLDDVLPFDRRASHGGWGRAIRSWRDFLGELRRRRFDLAIDLQGLFRTAGMMAAPGGQRRGGLSTRRRGATPTAPAAVPL